MSVRIAADALDPLLTRAEVCRTLRIGRATSYEWERAGHLPRPLRIGPGAVRWRRSDIEGLLQRADEDRGAATGGQP